MQMAMTGYARPARIELDRGGPGCPPPSAALEYRSVRTLLKIIQIIWVVTAITVCTGFGIAYGWQTYGIGGAIGCGLLGLIIGVIVAAGPQLWLGLAF